MHPAIPEWIKRLETGVYKQGRGRLRCQDGSRCALGVMAEVLVERGEGRWDGYFLVYGVYQHYNWLGSGLIEDVLKEPVDIFRSVYHWNDNVLLTFPQIADRLREHFHLPRQGESP